MKTVMIIIAMILFLVPQADACVGKTLHIGVLNSSEGQVFAEMLSALINERTGTTVAVKFYRNMQELYAAVKVKQVDISIENTARALHQLNKPAEPDAKKAYDIVKTTYEKEMGVIWLRPLGFLNGSGGSGPSHTSVLLRSEIINNFPVLPRVIDKLGSAITDETYKKLVASVESGEKSKKVARDFLKSKKLI